jgi:hypothetical protein
METTDESSLSRRIVKTYSFEIDARIAPGSSAYALQQVLARDRGEYRDLAAPWRRFFETAIEGDANHTVDPSTEILNVELLKLKERWAAFYKSCPPDDTDSLLDLTKCDPSMESVLKMVENMQTSWQKQRQTSRLGRTMGKFRRFCKGVESHSTLLQILPQGNEYVSVFTGTLNLVLKASSNHERVMEGLSTALCDITDQVSECLAEREMFDTVPMRAAVAELYAEIFLFLSELLDYLSQKRRKRLLDSFNEDLYKRFEDQLAAIQKKAAKVQTLAVQGSRAELRATRLELESVKEYVIAGKRGEDRLRAELVAQAERLEAELARVREQRQHETLSMRQLSLAVNKMLGERATQAVIEAKDSLPNRSIEYVAELGLMPRSPTNATHMADDILLQSKHMEDFFERDRVRLPELRPVNQTQRVIGRLSDWVQASPGILWLEGGPYMSQGYSPVSALASKVVELAENSGVPVIS